MEAIIRNILRLYLIGIYPIILVLCACFLLRKNIIRNSLRNNWKSILFNTIVIAIVGLIFILVFFSFEDNIYSYDYAGHWIRALRLRELFFENPYEILNSVYNSMNYNEYNNLAALLNLGFIVINTSYGFFVLSTFLGFLVPIIMLMNVLYFSYTKRYPLLPILISVVFYPLYLSVIYGEIDVIGILFVAMACFLVLFQEYDQIDMIDNLFMNFLGFMMIFLRRWYLFVLVAIYFVYFVRYIVKHKNNLLTKESLVGFLKILSSGIVLLFIILVFFMPFFKMVVGNNFEEAYSFYNRSGKLNSLINFYSPVIIAVSIYGLYVIIKDKYFDIAVNLILLTVIPLLLFWRIQSLEYHHYYMITLNILILFTVGIYSLLSMSRHMLLIIVFLLMQLSIVFCPKLDNNIPFFTELRKYPVVLEYKKEVIDFTYYLKSIMTEDWQSAYLASGSSLLNDDMIRNSILPDTDAPQIDTAVLDLRDGFPKDLKYIQFVITIDPIQYSDSNYQHIYDIITNAIEGDTIVSQIYKPIYKTNINGLEVTVHELVGEFDDDVKKYFYEEMIKVYPDKKDYFKYILE